MPEVALHYAGLAGIAVAAQEALDDIVAKGKGGDVVSMLDDIRKVDLPEDCDIALLVRAPNGEAVSLVYSELVDDEVDNMIAWKMATWNSAEGNESTLSKLGVITAVVQPKAAFDISHDSAYMVADFFPEETDD